MEITNKTEIGEVQKLKEKVNQLEEKQRELEIRLERLIARVNRNEFFEQGMD